MTVGAFTGAEERPPSEQTTGLRETLREQITVKLAPVTKPVCDGNDEENSDSSAQNKDETARTPAVQVLMHA